MREKIYLSDETCITLFQTGNDCGYEIIDNKISYYDGEKNSAEHTVVIQRMSDNKYFKGRYVDYGRGNIEYDGHYYMVIPKEVTTIVYE